MKLRITIDRTAGASYVYFREGVAVVRSETTPDGLNLDFDADDNLVGVELLDLIEVAVEDITDNTNEGEYR